MLLKSSIFCFSNVYRCFAISLRGKVERATICPPRHARARPLTCLRQWFYLIFMYMSSFIITLLVHLIYFIVVFVCRTLRSSNTDRRPFLRL
jgi:heme/copper-type cytochrome/quinol oxidase subunit 2